MCLNLTMQFAFTSGNEKVNLQCSCEASWAVSESRYPCERHFYNLIGISSSAFGMITVQSPRAWNKRDGNETKAEHRGGIVVAPIINSSVTAKAFWSPHDWLERNRSTKSRTNLPGALGEIPLHYCCVLSRSCLNTAVLMTYVLRG